MPLKIACQMDPIARTDIRGDSTFALLLEAQRRGHALFYYTPDALTYREGALTATGHDLFVRDTPGDFFTLGPARSENLASQDRRAAAPGPAVRYGLHHQHAPLVAYPPGAGPPARPAWPASPVRPTGRERPRPRPQRAGKALGPRVRRPHAADPDLARPGRYRGVPARLPRHNHKTAVRQWRGGRVPHHTVRSGSWSCENAGPDSHLRNSFSNPCIGETNIRTQCSRCHRPLSDQLPVKPYVQPVSCCCVTPQVVVPKFVGNGQSAVG
jgi:hypothetical protein